MKRRSVSFATRPGSAMSGECRWKILSTICTKQNRRDIARSDKKSVISRHCSRFAVRSAHVAHRATATGNSLRSAHVAHRATATGNAVRSVHVAHRATATSNGLRNFHVAHRVTATEARRRSRYFAGGCDSVFVSFAPTPRSSPRRFSNGST